MFPDVRRKVDDGEGVERLRETKSKSSVIAFLLTSIRFDIAVGTGVVFYAKSG